MELKAQKYLKGAKGHPDSSVRHTKLSPETEQCNQTVGPPPNARRWLREGWYEDGLGAVRGLTEEEGP